MRRRSTRCVRHISSITTDTGNIIKYACRWKNKNGIQDLKKIMWYTQHLIDHLEKKEKIEEENN